MRSHSPCPCWGPCPGKLIGCSPSTPKLSNLHGIIVYIASWHDSGGSAAAVGRQGAPLETPIVNNLLDPDRLPSTKIIATRAVQGRLVRQIVTVFP